MPYTLWSRDRLLGESDLGFEEIFPRHRMGGFTPTELGVKLMPILTGVGRATRQLCRLVNSQRFGLRGRELEEALRTSPEQADVAEAEAHFEALQLELRGPDGAIVPTEWIGIRDTEEIIAFGEMVAEQRALADLMNPEPPATLSDDERRELQERERIENEEIEAAVAQWEENDSTLDANFAWNATPFPRYQIQVGLVTADDDGSLAL